MRVRKFFCGGRATLGIAVDWNCRLYWWSGPDKSTCQMLRI